MISSISLFNVEPIATDLANGYLFLTSNQRLASRISNAYGFYCRDHQHAVVSAPRVFSFNEWVEQCWQELLLRAYKPALDNAVLDSEQQLIVIEKIIEQSEQGQLLLRPAATAQAVAGAYETLISWRQDISSSSLRARFVSDDNLCLLAWLDSYIDYCSNHHFLPSINKLAIIIEAFELEVLQRESVISTVAFEEFTPLQQQLLAAATPKLIVVEGHNSQRASVNVVACDTQDQEIVAAALWAKQLLRNTTKHADLPRVAIVIPELANQREQVLRVMQEVFEPDYLMPGQTRKNLPFNFSAGGSLSDEPIITAALQLLELNLYEIDVEPLVHLLQSPFLSLNNQDVNAIAQLIELLAKERESKIRPARLRQLAAKVNERLNKSDETEGSGNSEVWRFYECLQSQATIARQLIDKQLLASEWAQHFNSLIFAMAWPGGRKPDSIEYQALDQWSQMLEAFAQQSVVMGAMTFAKAVSRFEQQLSRRVFQAKTVDSPLQVLGLLEASGLQFDHMWLCSMSAKQWPAAPRPNTLLPYALQRELEMPNATAERELLYAQQLSERFLQNAGLLNVSYAKIIDDNPAAISAVFEAYPQRDPEQILDKAIDSLLPHQEIRRRYFEGRQLAEYSLGDAPVLAENERVKGGTSLFANQAACAFKAFAQHRLALSSLPEPVIGLDSASRGNLLHRALELIWKQLIDSKSLLALDDEAQRKICADYADYSINEHCHRQQYALGARHQRIEKDRLSFLLSAWLNVERERATFTVVGREEKKVFRFAQLELIGRIDRIDKLDDGRYVIVDYKTGNSTINAWWGARPDQPQLPLYSTLLEHEGKEVAALAFAQVRINDCQLKGVGDEDIAEAGLQWTAKTQSMAGAVDWAQLKQQWELSLSALAQDFIDGKAMVDPKDVAKSCQYCDLSSICRISYGDKA